MSVSVVFHAVSRKSMMFSRLSRLYSNHSTSSYNTLVLEAAPAWCVVLQKPLCGGSGSSSIWNRATRFSNIKHTHTQSATQRTHHTHSHTHTPINLVNDPSATHTHTHTLVCLSACLLTLSSSLALSCTHYKLLILSHCTDSSAKQKRKINWINSSWRPAVTIARVRTRLEQF